MITEKIEFSENLWFLIENENYIIKVFKKIVEIHKDNKIILSIKEANIDYGMFLNPTTCILMNTKGKIIFVDLVKLDIDYKYTHIIDNICLKVNESTLFYCKKSRKRVQFITYDIKSYSETVIYTTNCIFLSCDESKDKISVFGISNNDTVNLFIIDKLSYNIEQLLPFDTNDLSPYIETYPLSHNFNSNFQVAIYDGIRLINATNIATVSNKVIKDIHLLKNSKIILDMFWFGEGKYFSIVTQNCIRIFDSQTHKLLFEDFGMVLKVHHKYSSDCIFINYVNKSCGVHMGPIKGTNQGTAI